MNTFLDACVLDRIQLKTSENLVYLEKLLQISCRRRSIVSVEICIAREACNTLNCCLSECAI